MPQIRRHAVHAALSAGVIPFEEPGVDPNYAPSRRVRIEHMDLALRIFPEEERFEGRSTIRFAPLALYAGKATFDLSEAEVVEVTDEAGTALPYHHAEHKLVVDAGDARAIVVAWRGGKPTRGLYFTGPKPAAPKRQHMAWTQCQDEDGHFVFPCHDHPGRKWRWSIRIEAPAGYTTLSNGQRVASGEEGGLVWSTWEQELPMPAYLFTAVVAKLHETKAMWRDRTVSYFAPVGEQEGVVRAMGKTPLMIEHFSQITGFDYPWPRYDQVVVHDFIFGGMENVACTTMADLLLVDAKGVLEWDPDYLVAHELAHQWFGDLVTCQDWSQGWLNESWATFMEAVWWEHDRSEQDAIWYRHQTMGDYLGEFNGRYRRALVSYRFRDPLDVFDRHLYQKGSCVLWTLRATLGADAFWTGVKQYLHDNAHRAVHSRDFQRALETATGENLDGFFQQWVDAPAHPALSIKLSEESGLLVCEIEQTQTGEGVPEAYRFPLVVEVLTSTGTHRVKLPIAERKRAWALPVDGRITRVRIDPGLNVLATHTWKGPMAWFVDALQDDDPVIVSRAAATLIDEGSAAALDAVRSAMEVHPFWGVRADIAGKLGARGGDDDQAALIDRLEIDGDPRVRRAAAEALGAFRNTTAADALLGVLEEEVTTWQLTGAALKALGTTRDSRAAEALREHLATPSWADTLPSRALVGLAATRDAAVLDTLVEHTQLTHGDRVRAAAAGALGSLATHVDDVKTTAVERLVDMLKEPGFRARIAAIAALGAIGDTRALGALGRMHRSAADGRTRRMAYEASLRIRRSQEDGKAMEDLQLALESLKEENADLRSRIEKLERAGT
ncbi:MAG: HEAT repeat domain-containing protein [Alphaproteobacteria bacterium]|nr:HEAT repeat domain-containing protein [Alphaproteobacteria bacterium]